MHRSNIVLAALLFLASSTVIGAPLSVTIDFGNTPACIGGTIPLTYTFSAPPTSGSSIYVFFGTSTTATTSVTVNGHAIDLPLNGTVWQAASAPLNGSIGTLAASIRNDASLIGSKICAVVLYVDPSGNIRIVARTGGPIIQDAIC